MIIPGRIPWWCLCLGHAWRDFLSAVWGLPVSAQTKCRRCGAIK